MKTLFIFLISVILLSSCSIQKMRYSSGFNIAFNQQIAKENTAFIGQSKKKSVHVHVATRRSEKTPESAAIEYPSNQSQGIIQASLQSKNPSKPRVNLLFKYPLALKSHKGKNYNFSQKTKFKVKNGNQNVEARPMAKGDETHTLISAGTVCFVIALTAFFAILSSQAYVYLVIPGLLSLFAALFCLIGAYEVKKGKGSGREIAIPIAVLSFILYLFVALIQWINQV